MPPNRLPIVDSDDGVWGDILRQYLMQEHVNDDTDNPQNGGHKTITIQPGTATAGTAPLKFSSGTLLTTPEAGAIEFLSDTLYFTDSSGPTRRAIATYPVSGGAEGDIYYRNSSGAFTRLGIGSNGKVLTVNSGLPSWETPVENTTFQDDTFTLQDNGDNTKQARFELSSISTSTTRMYTLPNSNTTLVGTGVAQTLTNKTLTSPRVNNLLDTNGNTVLNFSPVASADNYVTIHNNDGGWVGAQANGAATDIPFFIYPKGDGGLVLFTQTGETPTLKADGQDTNLNLNLTAKGTGTVQVDGVDVTTATNIQTLTNKTIDGGDNTLQNIPQSAITDLDTDMAGKLDSVDHTTKARGGSNIAFNPDFEDTSAGRTNYGSPIAPGYSTEQAHSGTTSWKWTTPTLGSTSGIQFDPSDPNITSNVSVRVQPGDKYYISAWVYSHAGNNHGSGGALQFTARFVDSTGSLSNSYQSETISLSSVPLSEWMKLHVSLDTPAGYDQVVVFFTATNSTPQGNIYYIDDLVWQPVSTYHEGAELELFNTKDEETNYEKVRQYWNGDIFHIATDASGTGTDRAIRISGGNSQIELPSGSGITLRRNGTAVTSLVNITSTSLQSSSSTQSALSLTPTVNQSGTAGYSVLLVNPSESATGSGTKLLADFQLGGVSMASINTAGVITAAAGTASGNVVTIDGAQTLTNKTLTGPRVDQLNDTNGNNVLDLVAIGSAVNQFYITNQSAGNYPTLGVDGSDTNIGFTLAPKGTGPVRIYASAGQTPKIDVAGPDSNLNLNLISKGTGVVQANGVEVATISGAQTLTNKTLTNPRINQINDTNGNASIYIAATASAVNYVNITNTATGSGPAIFAMGSDTDIQLRLRGKGTGGVVVYDGTDTSKRVKFDISNLTTSSIRTINFPDANATLVGEDTAQTLTNKTLTAPRIASGGYIADANGNEQIVFNTTASAVNHITLTNAAAGGNPVVAATGDDTNLHLILRAKGTGAVALQGNGQNVLYTNGVVSAVNYVTMTNSATGNAVVIGTYGTDTNVNLNLAPKGAGIVQADGIEVATISGAQTLTNKTINASSNTLSNVAVSHFAASAIVTEGEGISGNDNDTTIPTSAAVKDYVDNAGTTIFTDDTFTIQDNGDNTKQLRLQLSGLTTSTTRTLTVPDANTTIVGTDATQTLTNKTVEVQDLTDLYTVAPSNKNYMMTDTAGQYPAFNPVSKYLWHDLLRFNRWFSAPTYETYNGSWTPQSLNSMLFNGKEAQSLQVADGSTITAVRWTWNSGNVSWSNISWWVIGFTYDAGGQTNNVVIESSTNGIDWTTRHDSVTTASARPVWFSQAAHGGDSYIRLTITSTSGQVIELSSIRALSTRWGDQGGGSENELPYRWDNSANITIGTNTERSDGVLNIGSTSATTSAEGIFFGNDTNLYRSAASTLRTDDKLIIAPPSGNAGLVVNRVSGQPSIQADSSDGFLIMDSNGSQVRLNNYVTDNVSIAAGGGRVGIGTANITNTGKLELTASTSATEGISFGSDTNLYRSAADTLRTDDTLIVGTPGTSAGSVATIDGTQTLTNKTIDASSNTITNIDLADFAASAIVTESEGISGNDNDTTVPTSAAVKDYADGLVGNLQAKFKTGTVATAAGTAAKTVTLDAPWASHTPVAGDYFLITFTSGQSVSSPTLNINSSGAGAIRTPQNQTNSANTAVTAGGTVLLYYDGTTYVLPGATQNTTYSTISDAEIINTGSTTARLITGQRAETLMANEASVTRTLSNKTLSSGIISGTTELTGSINFTPDSGTILSFDGDPVIARYAGGNNKSIGIGADDAVFIGAGEARGQLDANIVIDAADETVYLAGETGVKVIASPDNWNSNWAGRVETVIDASGITWDGNEVWHAGNDGAGSGLDADTLDGQQASAFASASHTHTATEISDSTSVGRSVLTAANASAARSAIGAGTGDVTLSGAQTLTNKTMSGSSNTFSNIPQSAVTNLTTDLANKLSGTEFIHHARGGSNILIGSNFESTSITRTLYGAPSSSGYTTDEAHLGNQSWYWTTPASTAVGLYLSATDATSGYIATRPGDVFYMEAWVLSHASNSFSSGSINLTVRIVDSTGTLANSYASDNIATSSLSVGTWHKLSTYFTVPAGYDVLYLFVTSSDTVPSGETYYVDDVLLREVTDAQTAIQALYGSNTVGSTIQTSAVPDLSASKITSGTLPVSRGGTGAGSLSGVVIGNGTSAFTTVTAPSGAIVGTTDAQTLTNKTFSDGLKVGDSSAPVVLEIAGPNSSAAGATLTFSENSGTPKNGMSFRYNSSSNYLELVDDTGDTVRTYFNRSGGIDLANNTLTNVSTINSRTIPSSNIVGLSDVQALTNKDMTSGTNTWPTFNQNTTGSAATLTTARTFRTNLSSTSTASFNGSANVTPGVQGTLGVGNGGTGATTLTGIVVGNGTSPFTTVAAPSGAIVGTTDAQTLTNKTLTSPTINGNTSINGDLTVDNGTNSIISVISDDGGVSGIELYGSSQGTGYVEVGQSTTHGGGMYYNGDGTPSFASGEANDTIGFYRKSASVRSEVFYYAHNSDDVFFNGAISATNGTFTGIIQADELRTRTAQQLVLSAGESYNHATGQTGEYVYVNAEAGLQVNASPDNWGSAWAGRITTTIDSTGITWNGNTVWHAGNDGSGSGLDADTLDGQQASAFASSSHTHVATNISDSTSVGRSVLTAASASAARSAIGAGTGDGDVTLGGVQTLSNKTVNDNSFAIQDNSDNSKKMEFSLDGMTTSSTITLQAPNVTSGNHTLVVRNSTDVLKNKRIEPRVTTVASSATPSFNTDSTDLLDITALATNITSMTSSMSGTPTNGEKILIRIKDNGTPRSITWGASWRGIGVSLPIVTTASKTIYIGANYNANDSIWDVIAVEQEA